MLTETVSGKCPCCNYDKMVQRYGSSSYFQMDACPNCGFGYGSNHFDPEKYGEMAWISFFIHCLACHNSSDFEEQFEDDPSVVKGMNDFGCESIDYNGGKSASQKAYEFCINKYSIFKPIDIRRMIFDWHEQMERSDDVETTIFVYSDEDVKKHMATNPVIFKTIQ